MGNNVADVRGLIDLTSDEIRHHFDRLIGMSLYWAWLQIVFSAESCMPRALFTVPLSAHLQVWALSLCAASVVFIVTLLSSREQAFLANAGGIAASSILLTTGSLFLVASSYDVFVKIFAPIGAVLTGVGSATAFLEWGSHLAALAPRRVLIDTAFFFFRDGSFFRYRDVASSCCGAGTCVYDASLLRGVFIACV